MCFLYVLITLALTYAVLQLPRNPVEDKPDWGTITETTIPAKEGGVLEVWRVTPEGQSRGTVVLAHGWGRNRGRMVSRGRIFGRLGFTTIMHGGCATVFLQGGPRLLSLPVQITAVQALIRITLAP